MADQDITVRRGDPTMVGSCSACRRSEGAVAPEWVWVIRLPTSVNHGVMVKLCEAHLTELWEASRVIVRREDGLRGCWARWREMVGQVRESDRLTVRGTHWVGYKALLSDLVWEGVLTVDEARARRAKVERWRRR
jgi:hypothetical protein